MSKQPRVKASGLSKAELRKELIRRIAFCRKWRAEATLGYRPASNIAAKQTAYENILDLLGKVKR